MTLESSLVTGTMNSEVEDAAQEKLKTSISGASKNKGAEAPQPMKGYLDGVERAQKFDATKYPQKAS